MEGIMGRKIYALAALMCGHAMVGEAYAVPVNPNPIQFYAGLAGGMEQMTGRRSESLDEEDLNNPPARIQTIYNQNLRMSQANPAVSLMGGFLWNMPAQPLVLGPEIYFGRGSTLHSVKDYRPDPFGALGLGDTRSYTADFQRRYFFGILARAGIRFCEKYLAYLSLGYDRSQFNISGLVSLFPRSRQIKATILQKRKSYNGMVFGIGLEKEIQQVNVGIDMRLIKYGTQTFFNDLNQPAGEAPASVTLRVRPTIYSAALRVSYRF
jgi:hypothetical protein